MPEGTTHIGRRAFGPVSDTWLDGLTHVILPDGLKAIGVNAFVYNKKLTDITFPQSLTNIDLGAFIGCDSLRTVALPENLTTISSGVFANCRNLKQVILSQHVRTIGSEAFYGCPELQHLIILADNEKAFNLIKGILPVELQPLAQDEMRPFRKYLDHIQQLLNQHPQGITDETMLEEISVYINKARVLLEKAAPHPRLYQSLKQRLDSLIMSVHLHQQDLGAAISFWLDEKPLLNEAALMSFASTYFISSDLDEREKHIAMIALFKEHYQQPEIYTLLTKSILTLLTAKATPGKHEPLKDDIQKWVPLAVMKAAMAEVMYQMQENDPLKKPLAAIIEKLPHLTRQEYKRLLAIPRIKEALEKHPLIGSENIQVFELCYDLQSLEQQQLPVNDVQFLKNTIQRVAHDKNPHISQSVEEQEKQSILFIKNQLIEQEQLAAGAQVQAQVQAYNKLLEAINELSKYGDRLIAAKAKTKGSIAIKLANELIEILNLNKSLVENCDENEAGELNKFIERFTEKLNSKNKEMAKYRLTWSTLVANVAIALTGVGAIAIMGKLICTKIMNKRALFFFQKKKTTSEEKLADTKNAFSELNDLLNRHKS